MLVAWRHNGITNKKFNLESQKLAHACSRKCDRQIEVYVDEIRLFASNFSFQHALHVLKMNLAIRKVRHLKIYSQIQSP